MEIAHIALWTNRLEELRDFYTRYFNGRSNEKYVNPNKGFESYFIRFDDGCALELMCCKDIQPRTPEHEQDFATWHSDVRIAKRFLYRPNACERMAIASSANLE